jgi:hypothetical protein
MDVHLKAMQTMCMSVYMNAGHGRFSRGNPTKIWYAFIPSHGKVLCLAFIYLPVRVQYCYSENHNISSIPSWVWLSWVRTVLSTLPSM